MRDPALGLAGGGVARRAGGLEGLATLAGAGGAAAGDAAAGGAAAGDAAARDAAAGGAGPSLAVLRLALTLRIALESRNSPRDLLWPSPGCKAAGDWAPGEPASSALSAERMLVPAFWGEAAGTCVPGATGGTMSDRLLLLLGKPPGCAEPDP